MESIHNDIQFIAFWTIVLFIVIVTAAVMVSRIRERVRRQRTQRLATSYYAHPAGQGLAVRPPLERTRHMDRPGYDWTSDTL